MALARENLGRQVGHGTAEGPGFLGGFLADVWRNFLSFLVVSWLMFGTFLGISQFFWKVEVTVEGFLAF